MIPRKLETIISSRLFQGKAILVLGPRQVGKTTLMRSLVSSKQKHIWLNGDESGIRNRLADASAALWEVIVGDAKIIVIDEAQRIPNIGLSLKILIDTIPEIQILVTGSSALDLADSMQEPLTGRKFEYCLYPLSFEELVEYSGFLDEEQKLEQRLLYGYYPDVVKNPGNALEILQNLSNSYLYKDILMLGGIKKPVYLQKILEALALQLGNEVSYREVGMLVDLDPTTVERYIDLLEKVYVIFRLPSLSRNRRNEIKRGRKIYFHDCGIRNAVLNSFSPLALRSDAGPIWENFCIVERLKKSQYHLRNPNRYFWRTLAQQEIDYVEEVDGKMLAFEFKWNPKAKVRAPKNFLESYPGSTFRVITPENFGEWMLEKVSL